MIIGLLFIGLVIYIIVCMVQQKEIDKQKEKEAERYRYHPDTRTEHEKALDDLMLDAMNPYDPPPDISLDEYVELKRRERKNKRN